MPSPPAQSSADPPASDRGVVTRNGAVAALIGLVALTQAVTLWAVRHDILDAAAVLGVAGLVLTGAALSLMVYTRREREVRRGNNIDESHHANERLSIGMSAARIGLWDWEVPKNEVFFSEGFHALLGYEPGELEGSTETWERLCHPKDRERAWHDVTSHLDGKTARYVNEHRMRRKDGSWRWIRCSGEVIERDPNGNPIRIVGVSVDADEYIRQKIAQSNLEERMRLFVEYTPAAVAMFDRDMRYLIASRGWYEQYEVGLDEIIGRSHYEVFPTIPDRWKQLHMEVLGGRSCSAERDSFVREDGSTTWVRYQLHPWREPGGSIGGIIMFTQVINDQIEHEQRLEDALTRAESANNAKSEFLANMSHEIRTPITAILGYADLMCTDEFAANDEQILEVANIIRANGRHLLDIINDILDVSKVEAGKLDIEHVRLSPSRLIEDTVTLVRSGAREHGLQLSVTYSTPIPETIESDPTRLRQVLLNLLTNAVKFTESGGIDIDVRYDSKAESIQIVVRDTGIGMTREQLDLITRFEPFTQVDSSTTRRYGGTGLGLRISHSLASMLGGELRIESEYLKGTAVTFTFATGTLDDDVSVASVTSFAPDSDPTKPNASSTESLALANRRILLAEDGADNQRLIRFHLSKAGAEVMIAENGRVAMELVAMDENRFDLILMDMQMPELDGYSAARKLRKSGCTTPIVALTAHAMQGDREKCIDAGCDEYLTKPIDRSCLIRACAAICDRADIGRAATQL